MSSALSLLPSQQEVVRGRASALGTVVVSGASSGIGEATALHLAGLGYRVLAGVRSVADFERLERNPGVTPVILDITNPGHIDALVELIGRTAPEGLSALVNNAGVVAVGPVELLNAEEWRHVMDVNVHGTVALTTALLPQLLAAKGRVINIGSAAGKVALPLFAPYTASKFALEAFNDALRREMRDTGVHIVCVAPGAISSPIFDKHLDTAFAYGEGAADRYEPLLRSAKRSAEQAKDDAPPPIKVALVVAKAMRARRPKPRYAVGLDSLGATWCARLLSARVADALLRGLSPRVEERAPRLARWGTADE